MSTSVALWPRRTSRATLLSYNNTKPSPLSSFSYFDSNGAGNYCPLCAKREFCDQQREGPRTNKEKRKSGARGGKRTAAATLWAVLSHFSNSFQSGKDWKGLERTGKDGRAWSAKDSAYLWSEKTNSRPPPRALRTEMEPPWKRTALRTMERPRPVPPPSRVRPSVTR